MKPPKQIPTPAHPDYHHRPFHPHHLGLGIIAAIILLLSIVLLALFYSRNAVAPPEESRANSQADLETLRSVSSTRGFSFSYDSAVLTASYSESADADQSDFVIVDTEADTSNLPAAQLALTPKSGTVSAAARVSTMNIIQQEPAVTPIDAQAAQDLLSADTTELTLEDEAIITFGVLAYNAWTFQLQDSAPESPIYSIILSPVERQTEEAIVIKIQGLIGDARIPDDYQDVLETLRIGSGETLGVNVFGQFQQFANEGQPRQRYVTDLVSPAVVKIYHVLCGRVQLSTTIETFDQCRAVTGSGFFISQDGLIATNGHVVVYEPRDALVDALVDRPQAIAPLLSPLIDISADTVTRLRTQPELLAQTVSQIYALPESAIAFQEKEEALLVSLGARPLLPESDQDIEGLFSFRNTTDIKNAELVAHDYTGEDQLNLLSGNAGGFTKSDVALLKIPMQNAPLITLAQPADISQGQSIAILGFPSDAENQLVDTSELVVSTTYGAISSIRTAAGGGGRLFQTDSDASQGNSGGPAINQDSQAVGLLTYRFKDNTTQNAAKSYVRDIDDIRTLLLDENLSLDVNSSVQLAWEEGLELYSKGRFIDALPVFKTVARAYPQHRLVDTYMAASEQNIAAGLDTSAPPIQFYVGFAVGVSLLALAGRLMVTHHGNHKEYTDTSHSLFHHHTPHYHQGA